MSKKESSTKKAKKGFTIVELLIVIVVIGILAAITLVTYNGVQARAKTTAAESAAKELQNKAEAYASDDALGNGAYPNAYQLYSATGTAALSTNTKSNDFSAASTTATTTVTASNSSLGYQLCPTTATTGSKITYWDYTKNAVSTNILYAGAATSTSC
jgi:prepilin-type N-terminal cleavage/methylation domain-containing protein